MSIPNIFRPVCRTRASWPPPGYTEVEYIDTTASLDLGVEARMTQRVEIRYRALTFVGNSWILYAKNTETNVRAGLSTATSVAWTVLCFCFAPSGQNYGIVGSTSAIVEMGPREAWSLNEAGERLTRYTYAAPTQDVGANWGINNNLQYVGSWRLWYIRIYEDDRLIVDLRPYKDTEGRPCLLDLARKIIYNA